MGCAGRCGGGPRAHTLCAVSRSTIPAEERQVNLLLALRSTGTGLTVAQILGTVAGYGPGAAASARRMFERDKEVLRSLGIVLSVSGTGEETRYRLAEEDYAMPPVRLSAQHAAALALAASAWRDGSLPGVARQALTKLRAVAALGGEDPSWALPDLTVDLAGNELPAALVSAVEERRRVTFDYVSSHSGTTRARSVEPHRLTMVEGAWYLDGVDTAVGAPRRFRLARILGEVTVHGRAGAFAPARHSAPGPSTAVLAVLPGRALGLRRRAEDAPAWARRRAARAGRQAIAVTYTDPFSFAGTLAALGEAVVVLKPADLRQAVLAHLRGAAALGWG